MNSTLRLSGIAILCFAILYLASFVFSSPIVGFKDGDDPGLSLEFLIQHPNIYFLSGIFWVLAAISLIVAVLAIMDTLLQPSTLLMRIISTFGLFSAAFFFCNGIMRMQTPGTLAYIAGLNLDWGQSAYLVVQIAGTQGLASAGIFALSAWTVLLSLAGWRSQKFPRALVLFGILLALPWVMGLLGRLVSISDDLWLLYIGSIALGIPLWSALLGITLLRRESTV